MSDIKIVWQDGLSNADTRKQQGSEFYCWNSGETLLAEVKRGERTVRVVASGEMYLAVPRIINGEIVETGDVIRYTQDLEDYGIDTDLKMLQYTKQMSDIGWEVWHMNNWFEVYDEEFPDGEVCDTLDGAIETARAWLEMSG